MSALLAMLQKKKQELANKNNRVESLLPGTSTIRVMGSWRPDSHPEAVQFWHEFGQHFIKDDAGAVKAVHTCNYRTYGTECKVCATLKRADTAAAGDESMLLTLKDARAGGRYLVNAMVRSSTEPNKVRLIGLPSGVFDQILGIFAEHEEAGSSTLGAGGIDLKVTRSGAGLTTKYQVMAAVKSSPIDPALCQQGLVNLDDFVASQGDTQSEVNAITAVNSFAGIAAPVSATTAAALGIGLVGGLAGVTAGATPRTAPAPVPAPAPAPAFEDIPDFDVNEFVEEVPAATAAATAVPDSLEDEFSGIDLENL